MEAAELRQLRMHLDEHRWLQLGAVSPIMEEENACSNPLMQKTKWKLFNDQETIDAWKSSCPRLTIWEDAVSDRLVRTAHDLVHKRGILIGDDRGRNR